MKALFDILGSIIHGTTKIDVKTLPTQGFFYADDFEITIKKASVEDIIEYEFNFNSENVLEIIEVIKKFVHKNIKFSKNYLFDDLKSIDVIFIFLEIVRFTNKKPIKISYFDSITKKPTQIDFTSNIFNYFDFSEFESNYIRKLRSFEIDGYRFSMPSIGVEDSVTRFLVKKAHGSNSNYYNDQNYDFLFFLGDKNQLTDDEIENLILIFNQDIDDIEKNRIKSIIIKFKNLIGYSLKVDNKIIDLKSNLDLENIWKD